MTLKQSDEIATAIDAKWRKAVVGGALAAALSTSSPAVGQYANEPFFEWTVLQSQAVGFELALQRLRIIDAVDQPYQIDFPEIVESLAASDYERFGGVLVELDYELALYLYNTLGGVAETVEEGGLTDGPGGAVNVNSVVPVARELLLEAYDLVVPREIREQPAFKAGIMAQLLLGEGGVAEGLEEAFVERWEYANGWSATQRVKALWAQLAPLATTQQQADVEEMIALLDEIYLSPRPPESFAGLDPEEAETPAQRLVGLLETIVDTALYSGRDQARLLNHLIELTGPACETYAAGDLRAAQVTIYAVADHYVGETTGLGSLIGLFAPEVHDQAVTALRDLVTLEDPSVGVSERIPEPDGPEIGTSTLPFERWLAGEWPDNFELRPGQEPRTRMPPAEACSQLLAAFEEALAVLEG